MEGRTRFALSLTVALALVCSAPAAASQTRDRTDASGPLDIARAKLVQHSRSLIFKLHARGDWHPRLLDRHPDPREPAQRFACLWIHPTGVGRITQLCFGQPGTGRHSRLGFSVLRHGAPAHESTVPASVSSTGRGRFEARFRPKDAGLVPDHYRWRAATRWSGVECPVAPNPLVPPCHDRAPDTRELRFKLLPVRPVGCRDSGPTPVYNGSRRHKVVALTFDDGPSAYTPQILSILEDRHARGTFFEVGDQIPGREGISRSVLRDHQEIANHSMHHELGPSRSSLSATSDAIKRATGFKPCLFRPPYGGYDSRLVGDAHSLDMTTVIWDVDPTDWSTPGSEAIYERVVGAVQPGSIVLMHDGGGDRSQTVDALPRIIDTLRDRGYRFATVSKLLGQRTIWRPVR